MLTSIAKHLEGVLGETPEHERNEFLVELLAQADIVFTTWEDSEKINFYCVKGSDHLKGTKNDVSFDDDRGFIVLIVRSRKDAKNIERWCAGKTPRLTCVVSAARPPTAH
jgi:hypothetical protein